MRLDIDVAGFRLDPARRPPQVDINFLVECGSRLGRQEVDLSDCVRPDPDFPGWEDMMNRFREALRGLPRETT